MHWTQKYAQEVHEDYPIPFNDKHYKIVATPINLNKLTDYALKKLKF